MKPCEILIHWAFLKTPNHQIFFRLHLRQQREKNDQYNRFLAHCAYVYLIVELEPRISPLVWTLSLLERTACAPRREVAACVQRPLAAWSINNEAQSCARSRVHVGPCHHYHYSTFNTKCDGDPLHPLRLQFEFPFPQLGIYIQIFDLSFPSPPSVSSLKIGSLRWQLESCRGRLYCQKCRSCLKIRCSNYLWLFSLLWPLQESAVTVFQKMYNCVWNTLKWIIQAPVSLPLSPLCLAGCLSG